MKGRTFENIGFEMEFGGPRLKNFGLNLKSTREFSLNQRCTIKACLYLCWHPREFFKELILNHIRAV